MLRLVAVVSALLIGCSNLWAQFDVFPKGPFSRLGLSVPFQAQLTDPNVTVQNYRWLLYTNDGTTIRTIDTLEGPDASTYRDGPLQLSKLPAFPVPQLAVTLTLRNSFSPTSYNVTRVFPIEFIESIYSLIEADGKGGIFITPQTRTIGRREQGAFGITQFPPGTTSASLVLIGANGDTIKRVQKTGTPIIGFLDALELDFDIYPWPGGVRVRANVVYDGSPTDGFVNEMVIPDSVPEAIVTASKGFGPFRRGVDLVNTFTAKGLGPACSAVERLIQYTTDDGQIHTPVRDTFAYDPAKDSLEFTYNMRDVSPGSSLIVRGLFGKFSPKSYHVETLLVNDAPPTHTINGTLPIKPGVDKTYTVRIDSLPPRIVELQMILTNATGAVIQQKTVKATAGAYIRTDSLSFNAKDLSLGTYVVRSRAVNEQRDDAPDFFFGFDVRDVEKYFLIADSWGPYTQGDSNTITPAVTDAVYRGQSGWSTLGRFMIVDSTKPNVPLYVSPEVSLEYVESSDSIVYWPDSSYKYGDVIKRRARIQTSDLPLTAKVILEVTNLSPTNERSPGYQISHPVFMAPSLGVLTSTPRIDSSLIVTRKVPVTIRFSNITPDATGVRFRVNGTRNTSALVQTIVPVSKGQKEVSFTFDAGLLPVNAVLTVAPVTSLKNDIGAEIVRTINTRPDTLCMRAEPPIDTILMEWDIEPSTQLIRGIARLDAKLYFTKLPAQTEEIQVLSYDDVGGVIDSTSYPVPYRLTYDSTLSISGTFPFRTFNTSSLQVRYITDGGPQGGIRYTKQIVTRYREPLAMRVRKMNYATTPPSVDNSLPLQGSNDILELAVRWRAYDPQSTVGYTSPLTVDSVRYEILDCAGQIIESMLVRPEARGVRTGSAADTLYEVKPLPLSTARVQARLYSKSMTLPSSGAFVSAPLNLKTNPNLHIPLGLSYPTYRVNDTVSKKLEQKMVITNLNAVVQIDSISIADKSGKVVYMYGVQRPRFDSIVLPAFDFNTLIAENAPYTINGIVRTSTCGVQRSTPVLMAKLNLERILADPASSNWIFSSLGWGPFQQGRAPESQFVLNFDPSLLITSRASVADSLELGLQPFSKIVGSIAPEVMAGYSYPVSTSLPNAARARATFNLTALDTSSSIQVRIRWLKKTPTGVQVASEKKYYYPVAMLPFPDQPIDPDTTRYEQSVLAGSRGLQVMPSNYNFGMRPQSSDIDYLRFTMLSSTGDVLDTFSIKPSSRDANQKTSIFKAIRDVAQYPWPFVAPEREHVTINIGYQFAKASQVTKVQKASIRILPRAQWLNGSTAELTGTATATSIPLRVSIPMPASVFESTVPVFGLITYFVEGEGSDKSTNLVVDATYNPASRQFTMRNSAPGGSFWVPTISIMGGSPYNKSSTSRDGQRSGEFTALYRFEEAPLPGLDTLIPNRELRVRSLYSSSTGGAVSMIHWIMETAENMERLIKTSTLVASGGILEITPTFVIDASVQHTSTINIGTEERGSLVHVGEEEPTAKTEQDEFPTSQSVAFTLTGGGGIEASLLGLIGIGASVTDDYMFASGSIFSGPVLGVEPTYYPTRLNYSRWFNMELSLFFGIINIDLFRGRMLHLYDPHIMPSYLVFDEAWESVFTTSQTSKPRDQVQVVEKLAKLPVETPYYRPAPCIAASDSQLVTVHLEQSLLGRNGRLMLSTLDRATHSLLNTAVIADNRNAMHDPTVGLVGNDGSALIAWVQNDVDAYTTPVSLRYDDLLRTENIHVAWYDAQMQKVVQLPRPAEITDELIDGIPTISVARDLRSAIIVWNGVDPESNTIEKYVRRTVRTDSGWKLGETIQLQATQGVNRSIGATSLDDGSYLVTWINDDISRKESRLMSARIHANGTVDLQQILRENGVNLSKARMTSNGTNAFLVFARSLKSDESEYDRSLDAYRFINGSWEQTRTIPLDAKYGVVRHIDVDIAKDGTFVIVIDAIDHATQGPSKHAIYAATGSIDQPSDAWKLLKNNVALADTAHAIWSLSTAIGPNRVYYVATQELDSIRDNRQTYTNGLQLGPSRCNAVIRAMRLTGKGDLEAVPFGNAVTSVDEGSNPDLEMAMRYRIKVMDPAPNPVREACVVPLAVQRACTIDVKVYDAVGSLVSIVYSGGVSEGIQGVSFAVSELTSGHYTVVVTDEIGLVGSVPLVVVK
jgi:hypothetical protein